MTQADLLAEGIEKMQLDVSSDMQVKLIAYLALLNKWNKVYNLTAVRDPLQMVTLHLLDSLSVLPYVQAKRLLDVGSGGGLPGIVLAICRPNLHVTTIDTVQKKAIFMRQVKGELQLDNLTVVHARVERYTPDEKFDAIISRAFSEITLFKDLSRHLLTQDGHWLAMKGVLPELELDRLEVKPSRIIPLSVAGLDAERHLIVFKSEPSETAVNESFE